MPRVSEFDQHLRTPENYNTQGWTHKS